MVSGRLLLRLVSNTLLLPPLLQVWVKCLLPPLRLLHLLHEATRGNSLLLHMSWLYRICVLFLPLLLSNLL